MTRHISYQATFPLLKNGLRSLCIATAALLLNGCDSGPAGSGVAAPAAAEAKIAGNVQDVHGPITDAKIEVRDKNGQLVATTQLSGSNQYSITVPAGAVYPILLTALPSEGSIMLVDHEARVRGVYSTDDEGARAILRDMGLILGLEIGPQLANKST
jgi:hypothetical protein